MARHPHPLHLILRELALLVRNLPLRARIPIQLIGFGLAAYAFARLGLQASRSVADAVIVGLIFIAWIVYAIVFKSRNP
jgi:hypothetical protein